MSELILNPTRFTAKIKGHEVPLKWCPVSPNIWGKNPKGKPLYRVIWSESRTYMLGGMWPDGSIEYRWVPYYGTRKEWVLEKWLPAEIFCGSERQWDTEQIDYGLATHGITILTMGPYPKDGWYEHCYSFPEDAPPNMEAIVPILESAKKLSLAQIKQGLNLYHERKRKEWEQKVEDGIKDAMPAFGFNAIGGSPMRPHGDTGGLNTPAAIAEAVRKYRGGKVPEAPPEISELPQHGVSIRQRGN